MTNGQADWNLLEKTWVTYQMSVASIRLATGSLFNMARDARLASEKYAQNGPSRVVTRAAMGATDNTPNGIPDNVVHSKSAAASQTLCLMTASIILIWFDSAIQEHARLLNQPGGLSMAAGDDIAAMNGEHTVKASTLIWAAANAVRHIDEWNAFAEYYDNPTTQEHRNKKVMQNRSMLPLAAVCGCTLPITENVSYEALKALTENSEDFGTYDRLELHVLRIGQDLVQRAGLTDAPIGLTIIQHAPFNSLVVDSIDDITYMSGIGRALSSLQVNARTRLLRNENSINSSDAEK